MQGPLIVAKGSRVLVIDWKDRATWHSAVGAWLDAEAEKPVAAGLTVLGDQDLNWDDPAWLELLDGPLDYDHRGLIGPMAEWLSDHTLRVYHGGRVEDASCYQRNGLLRSSPEILDERVRQIVREEEGLAWMRPDLDRKLAEWPKRDRDNGWLHVCIDDRIQYDDCGHYLLYGSEWIMAFLGPSAWPALRRRGVATMVVFNLALDQVSASCRGELAEALLQEWVHATVKRRDWTPERDFTFSLQFDLPPQTYVGHSHPAVLTDAHDGWVKRWQANTTCLACRPDP